MKTCSKCGFQGDEELFKKNTNMCKKCRKEYDRKRYEANAEKRKEYQKKYHKEHAEERREYRKKYCEEHTEEISSYGKKYYKEHTEKINDYCRKYNKEHEEELKKYKKKYYEGHAKERKEYQKKYIKTPKGKVCMKKRNAKRRKLGYEPINAWFKGSEAHHLRYSKNHELQDNDITIHVPRKLHRSIWHNGNTGKGMKEINIACLEWYFENTPEEEHNPKAKQLYWNYCTLPEPAWS